MCAYHREKSEGFQNSILNPRLEYDEEKFECICAIMKPIAKQFRTFSNSEPLVSSGPNGHNDDQWELVSLP